MCAVSPDPRRPRHTGRGSPAFTWTSSAQTNIASVGSATAPRELSPLQCGFGNARRPPLFPAAERSDPRRKIGYIHAWPPTARVTPLAGQSERHRQLTQ